DDPQMLLDEAVDVALVIRLRPAPLIVAARLRVRAVDDFHQLARAQPVELAALAADDRDEGSFAAADERHERREEELAIDLDLVADGFGERQRPPDVVESGAEEREAVGAVAVELVAEVAADAVEVSLESDPLVVRQAGPTDEFVFRSLVEQRVHA